MEFYHENYKKQLKHLLDVINDGKAGYKYAAQHVHSDYLRDLFHRFIQDREEMAGELQAHIGSYAEDDDGGVKGAFHRAIMAIKTALTKDEKDDRVILESCREGDRAALDAFDDVLQGTILETELKPFLTGLRYRISQAFNEVDKLYFDGFEEK